MGAQSEAKFSEWTFSIKHSDNSIWPALRFLRRVFGNIGNTASDINWAAQIKKELEGGRNLSEEELDTAAALLNSRSVTASGLAVEIMAACSTRQREEVMERIGRIFASGTPKQKRNAVGVLEKAGEVSELPMIASVLHEFGREERGFIIRAMEGIAGNRPGADIAALEKELRAQAAKITEKNGFHGAAEMRECLARVKKAAEKANAWEKTVHAGKKRAKHQIVRQKAC